MTNCKNGRCKQVRHCLLNICKQVVNLVTEIASLSNLHNFPCLQEIIPTIEPPLHSQSFLPLSSTTAHFPKPPSTNPLNRLSSLCNNCLSHPNTQASLPTNHSSMASSDTQSAISGKSAQRVKQTRQSAVYSGAMVHQAALPGTGFECLPALPISSVPFRFLKSIDLS